MKELDAIFKNFLWNNKPPLIKQQVIVKSKHEGGLDMLDLENTIKAKRIKWVEKIAN